MTPRLQAATGITVYVTTLLALVALLITDHPVTEVMVLAGPVVAALLVNARQAAQHEQTAAVLAKIDTQTNGVLDQRIADGVRAALADPYTGRHE